VQGGWSHAKPRRREERGSAVEHEHEHEHEHEESLGGLAVARAFQPEICPLRLGCLEIAARRWGVLQAVGLTRSREDAKEDAKSGVRGSGYEHEYEESLGGSRRSSGFPARDLPSATGVPGDHRTPMGGCCGFVVLAQSAKGCVRWSEVAERGSPQDANPKLNGPFLFLWICYDFVFGDGVP